MLSYNEDISLLFFSTVDREAQLNVCVSQASSLGCFVCLSLFSVPYYN